MNLFFILYYYIAIFFLNKKGGQLTSESPVEGQDSGPVPISIYVIG